MFKPLTSSQIVLFAFVYLEIMSPVFLAQRWKEKWVAFLSSSAHSAPRARSASAVKSEVIKGMKRKKGNIGMMSKINKTRATLSSERMCVCVLGERTNLS